MKAIATQIDYEVCSWIDVQEDNLFSLAETDDAQSWRTGCQRFGDKVHIQRHTAPPVSAVLQLWTQQGWDCHRRATRKRKLHGNRDTESLVA